MTNKAAHPSEINDLSVFHGFPSRAPHRYSGNIRWPKPLYDQIMAEAKQREWSFSRMVRHLCEASIDGIE